MKSGTIAGRPRRGRGFDSGASQSRHASAELDVTDPLRPGLVERLQPRQGLVRFECQVELAAPLLGIGHQHQRINIVGANGEDLACECDHVGVALFHECLLGQGLPMCDFGVLVRFFGLEAPFVVALGLLCLETVQLTLKFRKTLGRLAAAGDGSVVVAKVPVESDDQVPGLDARRIELACTLGPLQSLAPVFLGELPRLSIAPLVTVRSIRSPGGGPGSRRRPSHKPPASISPRSLAHPAARRDSPDGPALRARHRKTPGRSVDLLVDMVAPPAVSGATCRSRLPRSRWSRIASRRRS